jgi:hypothetical protein
MTCTNSQVQRIQRIYIDELDTDHDMDQDRFEELELDAGMLPVDTNYDPQINGPTRDVSSPAPSYPRKSTPRPPRRELVWKSQKHEMFSLEDIAVQYQGFLPTSSTDSTFNRRRGRYTTKTAHRCPGYNRIEITFTSDIARSAIVSHFTPTPHEICPVCNEVVQDAEIFACICGGNGKSVYKHNASACVLTL